MKKQTVAFSVVLAAAFAFTLGACSSKQKEDAKAAQSNAETKVEKVAGDAKKAAKEAKNKAAVAMTGDVKCTSGSDVRTISVKAVDQGCEVIYNKMGQDNSIASGTKGSEHCASVVTKVKENLQNAGFKCE